MNADHQGHKACGRFCMGRCFWPQEDGCRDKEKDGCSVRVLQCGQLWLGGASPFWDLEVENAACDCSNTLGS